MLGLSEIEACATTLVVGMLYLTVNTTLAVPPVESVGNPANVTAPVVAL